MPSLPPRSKRPTLRTLKRTRPTIRTIAQPKITRPTTEKIRRTELIASKVNVSLTPESPKMDPVKTVRIAITDGTSPMELEILDPGMTRSEASVENAENAEAEVVAAEDHEEDVVVPEAVEALEGSGTLTESLAMTRRVSSLLTRRRAVDPTIGVPTRMR